MKINRTSVARNGNQGRSPKAGLEPVEGCHEMGRLSEIPPELGAGASHAAGLALEMLRQKIAASLASKPAAPEPPAAPNG